MTLFNYLQKSKICVKTQNNISTYMLENQTFAKYKIKLIQ